MIKPFLRHIFITNIIINIIVNIIINIYDNNVDINLSFLHTIQYFQNVYSNL